MSPTVFPRNAVVLIVEDEVLLRTAAVYFVQDAGFQAIEAANADEAIALLESRDDIQLLFTDIEMLPGSMDGLKLAQAVNNRWPPIKIIVVSGHRLPQEGDLPRGSKFFSKPYEKDKVVTTMHEMLQAA